MVDEVTRRDVLVTGGALGTAGITSMAGCAGIMGGGGTVKVSSKKFTEEELLGKMAYYTLSSNTDLDVQDKTGLGGTVQNFKAVKNGQVGLYWEYTGTAWATLPPKHSKVITDPKQLYQKVKSEFEKKYNLVFLDRAPYNNTYVLMMNPDWAKQTGLTTLSDFASYINKGNTDFTVVMDAEFKSRADGWPGLAKAYGFDSNLSKVNVKTVSADLSYQIVGKGNAQVGMGFNTNPQITKFNLEVLKDDQHFFPVYNPAPLVDGKLLKNDKSIKPQLDKIGPKLTTDKIRSLNKKVSIEKQSADDVAKGFLKSAGII